MKVGPGVKVLVGTRVGVDDGAKVAGNGVLVFVGMKVGEFVGIGVVVAVGAAVGVWVGFTFETIFTLSM